MAADPSSMVPPSPEAARGLEPHVDPCLELAGRLLHPGESFGPYRFLRRVASGGMAHVALVHDAQGQLLALKVLKSVGGGVGLTRFKREFRALSRLRHENIIRVDALGELEGHPYFAMEYVEGRDLHQEIRSWKGLSPTQRWPKVEDTLADIAAALAYIHRKGLVHRDLKPSNILVDPSGRSKLTDFGIVKELEPDADPFVSTTLVGTWAYASPEQLSGAPIDHRSDLYSLGVILYAMLTGRRPFVAKDMAGWLQQHRDQEPVPPRVLVPEVPAHLDELCLRLLRKKPRDRLQAAADILARLPRVRSPELELRSPDGLSTDEGEWEPPLIGRSFQQDLLQDAVSALTRGEGGVVLLEGSEGSGRTRLFRLAAQTARQIGIPVHSARMTAQEGAFAALLRVAEDLGRELGAGVPPELGAAITAFARGKGRIAGDLRYQLFDGIQSALERLLQDGPVIVAFDDLHHAPAPIVNLLSFLARNLIVRDRSALLILVTVRSDVPTPALRGIREGTELGLVPLRIDLPPLDAAELERLLAGLHPEAAPAQLRHEAQALHDVTAGSPLLVAEALRQLRLGVGPADLPEDAATEMVADEGIPASVRLGVSRRLGPLPPTARALVELLAVAGPNSDLEVVLDAARAFGQTFPDSPLAAEEDLLLDALDELLEKGIATERRVGVQASLQLAHPRTPEVVYRDLPPNRRAALHRATGQALERRHGANPAVAEAIGEHLRRAGDPAPAWRFLVRAAVGLYERSLMADAELIAERARPLEREARDQLSPADFAAGRLGWLQVTSALRFNRGRWQEAREALVSLRGAALMAGDDRLAARAGLDLGMVLRRLGLPEEAEATVESVLGGARAFDDQATIIEALHRLAVFAWEEGRHSICEDLATQALISATGPEHRPARAQLLIALSAVQASRGQIAAATAGLEEAGGLLDALKNKRSSAVVRGNLAELLVWQGKYALALDRAESGLSLAREALYREGEGFLLRVRASAWFHLGDSARAETDVRAALAIGDDLGVSADLVAARYAIARLLLRRGEVDAAVDQLRAGLSAAGLSDPENYAPTLRATLAHARCIQGDAPDALALTAEVRAALPGLPLPRWVQVQLSLAEALAALSELDLALTAAREAAKVAGFRGLRTWALRARLLLCQLAPPAEAEQARREAAQLAEQISLELGPELNRFWRAQPGLYALWVLDEDDAS